MSTPNTSLAKVLAERDARCAIAMTAAAAAKNNSIVAARMTNEAVFSDMLAKKQGQMWIITNFEVLEGRAVGSGQCPGIVQFHGGLPLVREWIEGPKVKGNPVIPYGTAVATFVNGRYPNLKHGNHVAIYIDQDPAKGVLVFDQWTNRKAGYRWMPFGDGIKDRSNDGAALSIILTRKGETPPESVLNAELVPEF